MYTGIILCMRPANGSRRYNVTSSFIGWANSQNDPCVWSDFWLFILFLSVWSLYGYSFLTLLMWKPSQIARFIGPTWGPPGSSRPQMGPMLTPWILLSAILLADSELRRPVMWEDAVMRLPCHVWGNFQPFSLAVVSARSYTYNRPGHFRTTSCTSSTANPTSILTPLLQ